MTFVRLFKSSIFYNLRLTEIGQFFLFFIFWKIIWGKLPKRSGMFCVYKRTLSKKPIVRVLRRTMVIKDFLR